MAQQQKTSAAPPSAKGMTRKPDDREGRKRDQKKKVLPPDEIGNVTPGFGDVPDREEEMNMDKDQACGTDAPPARFGKGRQAG